MIKLKSTQVKLNLNDLIKNNKLCCLLFFKISLLQLQFFFHLNCYLTSNSVFSTLGEECVFELAAQLPSGEVQGRDLEDNVTPGCAVTH